MLWSAKCCCPCLSPACGSCILVVGRDATRHDAKRDALEVLLSRKHARAATLRPAPAVADLEAALWSRMTAVSRALHFLILFSVACWRQRRLEAPVEYLIAENPHVPTTPSAAAAFG